MHRVCILISTFNCEDKIKRQIQSILSQKDVNVTIKIRDDGSNESSKKILKDIQKKYKDVIDIEYGDNKGYKQSFIELVYSTPNIFDYYGFSDQDDIWMNDKLFSCINLMEKDKAEGCKLAHCNSVSVDEKLNPRKEQELRVACPPSFKSAISTEYFQGCGMVWNKEAMEKIQEYRPTNKFLAHDYWVGLVCYLAGKIYFCEDAKFYHIRYGNNESSDGNVKKGRIKRLKRFLYGKQIYMNPVNDLLMGHKEMLSQQEIVFLYKLNVYKSHLKDKIDILFDNEFRKPSIAATLLLKLSILLNRY